MSLKGLTIDQDKIFGNEELWQSARTLAGQIARDANDATSARVGITVEDKGSGRSRRILIGPRGAAAIPVEFGHRGVPGKRFFKRTIDRLRK